MVNAHNDCLLAVTVTMPDGNQRPQPLHCRRAGRLGVGLQRVGLVLPAAAERPQRRNSSAATIGTAAGRPDTALRRRQNQMPMPTAICSSKAALM